MLHAGVLRQHKAPPSRIDSSNSNGGYENKLFKLLYQGAIKHFLSAALLHPMNLIFHENKQTTHAKWNCLCVLDMLVRGDKCTDYRLFPLKLLVMMHNAFYANHGQGDSAILCTESKRKGLEAKARKQ